jgi:hypothetical protein
MQEPAVRSLKLTASLVEQAKRRNYGELRWTGRFHRRPVRVSIAPGWPVQSDRNPTTLPRTASM